MAMIVAIIAWADQLGSNHTVRALRGRQGRSRMFSADGMRFPILTLSVRRNCLENKDLPDS